MIHKLQIFFLLFMTYSFFGWCAEVLLQLFEKKKFINRGFLIGPYCPIYGWGSILMILFLHKYRDDMVALFFLGMIICAILEYVTSYLMEKIFHARWWDYSNDKFNVNGRISLYTLIPFGLGGVFVVHFINPVLLDFYSHFSSFGLSFSTVLLLLIFLTDNIISFRVLSHIRNDVKLFEKDNTEEISKKVLETIRTGGRLKRRLFSAYPNFQHIGTALEKVKGRVEEERQKYNEKQMKIKKKTEEKIAHAEEKFQRKIEEIKEKSNRKIIKAGRKNQKKKEKK